MSAGSFCTSESTATGEALAGTAIEDLRFVVCVEVPEAWPAKILKAALNPGLSDLLQTLDGLGSARVQFIRRPDREVAGGTKLFIADVSIGAVHGWNLSAPDAMCQLDWAPLIAAANGPSSADRQPPHGAFPDGGTALEIPLLLVCTHGRRDACCAKWGMALWRSLLGAERQRAVSLWQTSHLGGHRFAATALVLPGGYQYGRLEADDGPPLLEAVERGRLFRLDRMRGRICWSRAAQAGEVFHRTSQHDLDPASVAIAQAVSADSKALPQPPSERFDVLLKLTAGTAITTAVERKTLSAERPPSCGKAPEPVVCFSPARPSS